MHPIPALVLTVAIQAGGLPPLELTGDKLPGGTARWSWLPEPQAVSYDIIGDTLPADDVATAGCRTQEDDNPTDTMFDDPLNLLPGAGTYVLVAGSDGQTPGFPVCEVAAYFCVSDAAGDSFVLKLTDEAQIDHARDVVRGIEQQLIHVGALTLGGPVPWNPGWQFHIPPDSVYFFENSIEVCDASIRAVDQGGPPAGNWCPWTSEIFGELLPFEQWSGPSPEPFYCGPLV